MGAEREESDHKRVGKDFRKCIVGIMQRLNALVNKVGFDEFESKMRM